MRFAHLGDCHLGGWRHPELRQLNLEAFRIAVNTIIKEKLDFVLIAGDLFDTAYPPIETIKDAFEEFRKLKDAGIPVFLIAGSHDYSATGKSFLDVLEKAGFATNVFKPEFRNESIILQPTIFKNIAIYGYPGKKSGLEVPEIAKIKLNDTPGLFKILMLHTAIRDAVKTLPIPAVDETKLPKVDYLALAHLHIDYNKDNRVYCGPTFPNNSEELEELQKGSFYIVDTSGKVEKREIKLKEISKFEFEVNNAISATDEIIEELKKHNLEDKIIILRLFGNIEVGKSSDIKLNEIERYVKEQNAYVFLKSTSKLFVTESDIDIEVESQDIEEEIIRNFEEKNPHKLNNLINPLMSSLQIEKKEGEISRIFEDRLFTEMKKVIDL
ncbi:hypothetical protein COU62_01500 [Candidatus Pacearchaeota archaeon CG10_big_fil_rev_8_21_14_0_10_35_219]|nr:exonuclease SbcCD subunit D [Candidatus Pacearchaeota archaeon]OIO43399.1 MAG: hypothetical protein AUJ63_00725 [Candidatus Pacearchaeota archaeon CG1_02_35_32]PIO08043.1 MAG: hypothetical protein COU62_01500 [Candidatus Pacearchaeota archaeon CG10_big_fil_rev_8_21_14_0_10_35_219]PIY81555.1 MAG: hypothetical protein COY79_02340 [Candidatus Pacearchaeota archaeon CG_4_10_14_0_8_um_filter_35_169]PIZ78930.1 MAG: hypothetical protein COY00_04725 [Candidatus Pacearchaeota archaeon CG_4_10_14_0_2_